MVEIFDIILRIIIGLLTMVCGIFLIYFVILRTFAYMLSSEEIYKEFKNKENNFDKITYFWIPYLIVNIIKFVIIVIVFGTMFYLLGDMIINEILN